MKSYSKIRHIQNSNKLLEKRMLNEGYGGAGGSGGTWVREPGPGQKVTTTVQRPVTLDGSSLFPTGSDKIATDSPEFKKGIDSIKDALGKTKSLEVTVEGGASAVGSKTGYNNQALAQRRAENYVKSVKSQFPDVKFTTRAKVGVATVMNSPEAMKEQYVKLFFNTTEESSYRTQAVDNTAVMIPGKPGVGLNFKDDKTYIVTFEIKGKFIQKVLGILRPLEGVTNLKTTEKKDEKKPFWSGWFE